MFRQSLRRALLLCAISLAGCAPLPAPISPDASAMGARKMAISQQFQKDWERCVGASYQVIQQQMGIRTPQPSGHSPLALRRKTR